MIIMLAPTRPALMRFAQFDGSEDTLGTAV
jgi:hypothetical protein